MSPLPMYRHCWQVLAAAGLVLGASTAYADEAEISYYDVVGKSARDLRQQMNTKGPIGEAGKRADGHTSWNVAWSYRYAPAADGCKFTEIEITVTGTIALPRWVAGDRPANALVRKWQSYIAALRVHEDGHYSHGVRAAEEIKSLGQSFRTSDDCSTVAKQFNDQAGAILEKYKVADAAYDAATKHGQTQGAVFP